MSPSEKNIGIEVNFLTGRYIATAFNHREISEWPPHPARLFSALVAEQADSDEPDEDERAALKWLESQPPPRIAASKEAVERKSVIHYVPVNDASVFGSWYEKRAGNIADSANQLHAELASGGERTRKAAQIERKIAKARDVGPQVEVVGKTNPDDAVSLLPDLRRKQPRYFPSVTPDDPRVRFVWDKAPSEKVVESLDRLLLRVTRLGHSSSLVSCRIIRNFSGETMDLSKGDINGTNIRAFGKGQLESLEKQYRIHRGVSPRTLPCTFPYLSPDKKRTSPDTEDREQWIVFEFLPGYRHFPATRGVELATVMRKSLFHHADDPIPEEVSGHLSDGRVTGRSHVSFIPLPWTGHDHADGRLMGLAISIPGSLGEDACQSVYRAIGNWESATGDKGLKLAMGARGSVRLFRQRGVSLLRSLRPGIWIRSSRRWVSATPIALPRHPGDLGRGQTHVAQAKGWRKAEDIMRLAFDHAGLPQPVDLQVANHSFVKGVRAASMFPAFYQKRKDGRSVRRQLVHASAVFEDIVSGPLMIGSGRFMGLGLMKPLRERKEQRKTEESEKKSDHPDE